MSCLTNGAAGAMHICGSPGVGKTATITQILREFEGIMNHFKQENKNFVIPSIHILNGMSVDVVSGKVLPILSKSIQESDRATQKAPAKGKPSIQLNDLEPSASSNASPQTIKKNESIVSTSTPPRKMELPALRTPSQRILPPVASPRALTPGTPRGTVSGPVPQTPTRTPRRLLNIDPASNLPPMSPMRTPRTVLPRGSPVPTVQRSNSLFSPPRNLLSDFETESASSATSFPNFQANQTSIEAMNASDRSSSDTVSTARMEGTSNSSTLGENAPAHMHILILDESDGLFSRHPEALGQLFSLEYRQQLNLILLSISNDIVLPKKLDPYLKSHTSSRYLTHRPGVLRIYTSSEMPVEVSPSVKLPTPVVETCPSVLLYLKSKGYVPRESKLGSCAEKPETSSQMRRRGTVDNKEDSSPEKVPVCAYLGLSTPRILVFATYSPTQLIDILTSRLQDVYSSVVQKYLQHDKSQSSNNPIQVSPVFPEKQPYLDPGAVQFLCRRLAAREGDARHCLSLVRSMFMTACASGKTCVQNFPDSVSSNSVASPSSNNPNTSQLQNTSAADEPEIIVIDSSQEAPFPEPLPSRFPRRGNRANGAATAASERSHPPRPSPSSSETASAATPVSSPTRRLSDEGVCSCVQERLITSKTSHDIAGNVSPTPFFVSLTRHFALLNAQFQTSTQELIEALPFRCKMLLFVLACLEKRSERVYDATFGQRQRAGNKRKFSGAVASIAQFAGNEDEGDESDRTMLSKTLKSPMDRLAQSNTRDISADVPTGLPFSLAEQAFAAVIEELNSLRDARVNNRRGNSLSTPRNSPATTPAGSAPQTPDASHTANCAAPFSSPSLLDAFEEKSETASPKSMPEASHFTDLLQHLLLSGIVSLAPSSGGSARSWRSTGRTEVQKGTRGRKPKKHTVGAGASRLTDSVWEELRLLRDIHEM